MMWMIFHFGDRYKITAEEADDSMKEISIFDVIGPTMIGPSSSHTAGALRIALLAGKLVRGRIVRADFTLYGAFAQTYKGHGTDRALVAGVLGFSTDDPRIRDSFSHAEQAGLAYSFTIGGLGRDLHPNTVDITLQSDTGQSVSVRGVSTGGGSCLIERIDGVAVSLSGDYNTLLIRQQDTPGVVAYITGVLSDYGINIAFMRMYRETKGQTAYTIIEVDGGLSDAIVPRIEGHPAIDSALLIQI